MDLLLIRHGQSEANQKGLLISNDKDDLTRLGQQQSERLAQYIQAHFQLPEIIYSSPWQRAKATAERVFIPQSDAIHYDARLAETNPGEFETWQEAEFNRQFPDFYDDLNRPYKAGESHMQMAKRVIDWVETCIMTRSADEGLVAVVAHGGPISIILQYLFGMPIEQRYPTFTVPNASYSHLIWRADLQRYCATSIGLQPE